LQVVLGLVVGAAAHNIGLGTGYAMIGLVYTLALVSASWSMAGRAAVAASEAE